MSAEKESFSELKINNHNESNSNNKNSIIVLKTKQPISNELAIKMNNGPQLTSATTMDNDFLCGIFRWHPKCLQRFTNKRCFLVLFCLATVLQGIYYTYFVSVLTTIEKLYQIPSKTTGMIMSSAEISQITGALLLAYYGGQGHRPRWIATGMLVFAFALLFCSTPHYLFGSQPIFSQESPVIKNTLCTLNFTNDNSCQHEEVVVHRSQVTNSVLGIFFVSLLMIGLGNITVYSLGIPYIDDNVASKESVLIFGITYGVRIFGPFFGFILGSICTSIPVQFPFGSSDLLPTDPNWIGAWWLGLFLIGLSLTIVSIPMMIFPRRLPQPDPTSYCHRQQQSIFEQEKLIQLNKEVLNTNELNNTELVLFCDIDSPNNVTVNNTELTNSEVSNKLKLFEEKNFVANSAGGGGGFSHALKRILTNDILLLRTASSVLHLLPMSGVYTFLPKYLENQFQLTATDANVIVGLAGLLVMGIGVTASGIFMYKFNPSARFVAQWIAFTAFCFVIGFVMLMFVGCPANQFAGLKNEPTMLDLNNSTDYFIDNECSDICHCPGRFDPICMSDGTTYISPCLAGCTTMQNNNSDIIVTCLCYPNITSIAKPGICPLQCNMLIFYVIIFSLTVFIHSTSDVGSLLLNLRCVQPQDKAIALGFVSFANGLFGNIPCPIIYGTIIDWTCRFWEKDCGERGACRLYDSASFRQMFHGLTAVIMFFAFCIDLIVCYKASAIQFHEEKHDKNDNKVQQQQ